MIHLKCTTEPVPLLHQILIQPKTSAMEVSRITIRKIGLRYRIVNSKIFLLRKVCPLFYTSRTICPVPILLVTIRQIQSAAMGIMTEFVRKSEKSRKAIPASLIITNGP